MNDITSGTGSGLIEFLTWAGSKGSLNKNTAGAFRAASRELLAVEAGSGEFSEVDIRTLDVEDLSRRFANLRAAKYSSGSLETYQSRFRRSVEMYKKFLENPAVWRPDTKERTSENSKKSRSRAAPRAATPTASDSTAASARVAASASNLIVYPFPVRHGVVASLSLPADMTGAEARRLAAFLQALAIDEASLVQDGKRSENDHSEGHSQP